MFQNPLTKARKARILVIILLITILLANLISFPIATAASISEGKLELSQTADENSTAINTNMGTLVISEGDVKADEEQFTVNIPKQGDPFKGSFIGSQTLSLNQTTQITFSVYPVKNMLNSTIEFFLPPDVELITGDLKWQGDLERSQQLGVSISINVTERVKQYIKVEAITYLNGTKVSRSYYFPCLYTRGNQFLFGDGTRRCFSSRAPRKKY